MQQNGNLNNLVLDLRNQLNDKVVNLQALNQELYDRRIEL